MLRSLTLFWSTFPHISWSAICFSSPISQSLHQFLCCCSFPHCCTIFLSAFHSWFVSIRMGHKVINLTCTKYSLGLLRSRFCCMLQKRFPHRSHVPWPRAPSNSPWGPWVGHPSHISYSPGCFIHYHLNVWKYWIMLIRRRSVNHIFICFHSADTQWIP